MRIAQVTCSLTSGGAERLATDLSVALSRMGHAVDFVTVDKRTFSEYETAMLERLSQAGVEVCSLGRQPGSGYLAAGCAVRLAARIARRKYDIVHSHLCLSHVCVGLARRLSNRRCRHVLTVHDTREQWSRLTSIFVRNATVVFCSDAVAGKFSASGRTHTIHNGIDLTGGREAGGDSLDTRRSLGIPDDAVFIVSVGNLREQKNYSQAIEAVSFLQTQSPGRNIHYAICGQGAEDAHLREQIRSHALDGAVHLLGARLDVPNVLRAADCFLSASKYEGMPLSVLEALRQGAKCALSPIPEHRSLVDGMVGCAIAADTTPAAMASAVSDLLRRKESHQQLSDLRRQKLERFSFETCVASYERLYRERN